MSADDGVTKSTTAVILPATHNHEPTIITHSAPPDTSFEAESDVTVASTAIITGDNNALIKTTETSPAIPIGSKSKTRPTNVEVFTGQAIGIIDQLFEAQETNDRIIQELREAKKRIEKLLTERNEKIAKDLQLLNKQNTSVIEDKFIEEVKRANDQVALQVRDTLQGRLNELGQIKKSLGAALHQYQWTPGKLWLYQWSLVVLLVITGIVQAIFIEFYCRWHGSYFISWDLYNPVNVQVLSQITFVNGPTTMSVAAEVLVWSSLGVWTQQSYANTMKMLRRKFRFADDGPRYMGTMMRNTSVAAIIVIILRLSQFSLFGVSLEPSNPLAFDFTIGLSFLLGFFGDDAYRILASFKERVVSSAADKSE